MKLGRGQKQISSSSSSPPPPPPPQSEFLFVVSYNILLLTESWYVGLDRLYLQRLH